MSARGILENPAMFDGARYTQTPPQAVKDWLRLAVETGTQFTHLHHHLIYMLDKIHSKSEKKHFNSLNSTAAVIDYLRTRYPALDE